ncbi:hypothetical protein ABIE78_001402 [Sinorhizobium fredii]|jgi:hypothetical protein
MKDGASQEAPFFVGGKFATARSLKGPAMPLAGLGLQPYSAAWRAMTASNTASKAAWITSGPALLRVASAERIWR